MDSISIQFQCDFRSISIRFQFGFNSVSIRFQFDFNSISILFQFDLNSISILNSISVRFQTDFEDVVWMRQFLEISREEVFIPSQKPENLRFRFSGKFPLYMFKIVAVLAHFVLLGRGREDLDDFLYGIKNTEENRNEKKSFPDSSHL